MANNGSKINKNILLWIGVFLLLMYILRLDSISTSGFPKELSYGEFYRLLESNKETGTIKSVVKVEDELKGVFSSGIRFMVHIPAEDQGLLNLLR